MGIELENMFEVNVPIDVAWDFFMDPERVVACMPGAELVEVTDPSHWKVQAVVKVGAVKMTFKADVEVAEADDSTHHAVLKAEGKEQRGMGNVKATIQSQLASTDSGGTRVTLNSEVAISGKAARFARGMVKDVSAKFTQDFADAMEYALAQERGAEAEADADAAAQAARDALDEARAAAAALEAEPAAPTPAEAPEGVESLVARAEEAAARAEKAAARIEAALKEVDAQVLAAEAAVKQARSAAQKAELASQKPPDTEVSGLAMVGVAVRGFFARLFGGGGA